MIENKFGLSICCLLNKLSNNLYINDNITAQIEVIDINDNNNDNTVDVNCEAPAETSTPNFVAPVEEVKTEKK